MAGGLLPASLQLPESRVGMGGGGWQMVVISVQSGSQWSYVSVMQPLHSLALQGYVGCVRVCSTLCHCAFARNLPLPLPLCGKQLDFILVDRPKPEKTVFGVCVCVCVRAHACVSTCVHACVCACVCCFPAENIKYEANSQQNCVLHLPPPSQTITLSDSH